MECLWDKLSSQPRYRTRYPSEHAVRFLAGMGDGNGQDAIDIGCGAGRHLKLLREFGYVEHGVDISLKALRAAAATCGGAGLWKGDAQSLPFEDGKFAVALAFGSLYYGELKDTRKAIVEIQRVLKPGGSAFVVLRTLNDSRYLHGRRPTSENPWVDPDCSLQPEDGRGEAGMMLSFASQGNLANLFSGFSAMNIETSETTREGGQWMDSDWLVSCRK